MLSMRTQATTRWTLKLLIEMVFIQHLPDRSGYRRCCTVPFRVLLDWQNSGKRWDAAAQKSLPTCTPVALGLRFFLGDPQHLCVTEHREYPALKKFASHLSTICLFTEEERMRGNFCTASSYLMEIVVKRQIKIYHALLRTEHHGKTFTCPVPQWNIHQGLELNFS